MHGATDTMASDRWISAVGRGPGDAASLRTRTTEPRGRCRPRGSVPGNRLPRRQWPGDRGRAVAGTGPTGDRWARVRPQPGGSRADDQALGRHRPVGLRAGHAGLRGPVLQRDHPGREHGDQPCGPAAGAPHGPGLRGPRAGHAVPEVVARWRRDADLEPWWGRATRWAGDVGDAVR